MTTQSKYQQINQYLRYTNINYKGVKSYQDFVSEYGRFVDWNGADRTNWRSLVKNQQDATNPYTAYKWSCKSSPLFVEAEWRLQVFDGGIWYDSMVSDQLFGGPSVGFVQPPPDAIFNSSEALNAAKSKFISAARHAMSPFSGGVFLGELTETIHLIRNPASSFRSSLTSYLSDLKKRRNGFKKASVKKKERFLASSWLEYSFGVLPLISDVDSGCEALAQFLVSTVPTTHVQGTGRAELADAFSHYQNMGLERWRYSADRFRVLKTSYRIEGAVKMAPSMSLGSLQQISGFGIQDFLPTIWELIPYSFLVDYFSNIGKIIEAATFITSNLVWVSQSQKTTETYYVSEASSEGSPYPGTLGSVSGGKGEMSAMRFQRSIPGSLVPSLQFNYPQLGSTKWINIAALGAQHRNLIPF